MRVLLLWDFDFDFVVNESNQAAFAVLSAQFLIDQLHPSLRNQRSCGLQQDVQCAVFGPDGETATVQTDQVSTGIQGVFDLPHEQSEGW